MSKEDILYTAVIAGAQEHELEISRSALDRADIIRVTGDTLHILEGHRSHLVQIIKADYATKEFVLRIEGRDVQIKLRDEIESRVHAMGFDINRNHVKLRHVTSPMPGMVLKILVNEGDHVREGDPVIVLEAMKMENVLSAPVDGIVKIHVQQKQNVDKNQLMVEIV